MYYYNQIKKEGKIFIKNLLKANNVSNRVDSLYYDFGIINPSIGTSNLGDLIILDAVIAELRKHYPNDLFTNFPSQLNTNLDAKRLMSEKDYLFVSGTNLLSSNMDSRDQWKLDPGHKRSLQNKVILCGVGWWQYQEAPNRYTENLYKSILTTDSLHSVRDSYTMEMLKKIGIENVVNTTCPTLWSLSTDHCMEIPTEKSKNVVTTLTFYKANPDLDHRMLEILNEKYEKIYLWVQGLADVEYLNKIYPNNDKIELIPPTIEAYNKVLELPSVEYVGTRLHAGVRALQNKLRTLIIAVDNRAIEIGKDTNLNVIERENVNEMFNFIDNAYKTDIRLPVEAINSWRESLPNVKRNMLFDK